MKLQPRDVMEKPLAQLRVNIWDGSRSHPGKIGVAGMACLQEIMNDAASTTIE
jgi:hypothetical protein